MSEDVTDQELGAIHERVGGWFNVFMESPQYAALTETQKDKAPQIVHCLAEYSHQHLGAAPEQWNRGDLAECCVEILPRKMSAPAAFFQAMAPVLSAFFSFLADKGWLGNARALAETATELGEQIVAASQDQRQWGPAKSFAMAALEAGVDLNNREATNQFMAEYNLQHFAQPQPVRPMPLPFHPAAPLQPAEPSRRSSPKVGRNDPCPCGSGNKFKKCCGR